MQAYFEPEQAFSISMPQPAFEISMAYIKKKNLLGQERGTYLFYCSLIHSRVTNEIFSRKKFGQ